MDNKQRLQAFILKLVPRHANGDNGTAKGWNSCRKQIAENVTLKLYSNDNDQFLAWLDNCDTECLIN